MDSSNDDQQDEIPDFLALLLTTFSKLNARLIHSTTELHHWPRLRAYARPYDVSGLTSSIMPRDVKRVVSPPTLPCLVQNVTSCESGLPTRPPRNHLPDYHVLQTGTDGRIDRISTVNVAARPTHCLHHARVMCRAYHLCYHVARSRYGF